MFKTFENPCIVLFTASNRHTAESLTTCVLFLSFIFNLCSFCVRYIGSFLGRDRRASWNSTCLWHLATICSVFVCIAAGSPCSRLTSQRSTLKCQWEANKWSSRCTNVWVFAKGNQVKPIYATYEICWVRIRDAKLRLLWFGFLPFVSVRCLFCRLANLKDPGSAQLRPIKDTCVYL